MAELDLKYVFDKSKNKLTLYNHRMITGSLYYNAFIQETVLESGSNETIALLSDVAEECTLTLMSLYFNEHPEIENKDEKRKIAALLYKGLGYGILNLNNVTEEGGIVKVEQSNVVEILRTKFNKIENSSCKYTDGFIRGLLSAVYQRKAKYFKISEIFDYFDYGYKVRVEVNS